jgi:hypothetical protein
MDDLWEAQKGYIDAAASCQAYKAAGIVTTIVFALSIFYGINITMTAFKLDRLEQRLKALESQEAAR